MCEWLKQAVLKTAIPERVSGVRIPLPPPVYCFSIDQIGTGAADELGLAPDFEVHHTRLVAARTQTIPESRLAIY